MAASIVRRALSASARSSSSAQVSTAEVREFISRASVSDLSAMLKGVDGETKVRFAEALYMGGAASPTAHSELQELFKRADVNQDGMICAKEFTAWYLAREHHQAAMGAAECATSAAAATATGAGAAVQRPTRQQLVRLGVRNMVPMVGFGFVDNFGMIIAGESIDSMLGVRFGFSTMAAAALGNTLSDIAGLGLSNSIEAAATKIGIPSPGLTLQQLDLPISRVVITLSSILGVTTGCLLGMSPLLFIDTGKKDLQATFDDLDVAQRGTLDMLSVRAALKKANVEADDTRFNEAYRKVAGASGRPVSFEEYYKIAKDLGHKSPWI